MNHVTIHAHLPMKVVLTGSALVVFGILFGLALTLLHAHHLPEGMAPHTDAESTAQALADRPAASESNAPHPITMDCPAPQWNVRSHPTLDILGPDLCAAFLAWDLPSPSTGMLETHCNLPVARGPDAQALLQRFTL